MKTEKLSKEKNGCTTPNQPEMVMVDKRVLDLLNERIKVLEDDRIPTSALLAPKAYALFGGGSRDDRWDSAHNRVDQIDAAPKKGELKRNVFYGICFFGFICIGLMLHFY